MKTVYLTIITSLFLVRAYSQEIVKADPTAAGLKTYLAKNIRFPAIARENNVQGRLIVAFKIDDNKKINEIHFLKNLSPECDAEVVRVLSNYSQAVLLPPAEYTVGVQFLIEKRKHKSAATPVDKDIYQNFLFDINITVTIEN